MKWSQYRLIIVKIYQRKVKNYKMIVIGLFSYRALFYNIQKMIVIIIYQTFNILLL